MKRKGRPVLGVISGLLFGVFLALDLILFGVVPLDSPLIYVLPVVGIVIGALLGITTPLGRGGRDRTVLEDAPPEPEPATTEAPE